MTARFVVGDVFDRLAELPDASVDLVVTSPPFLALRSYLPPGHTDKGHEIGTESTPAEYLDALLALTAEWGRVLAPHGSLCVELGDSYTNSGGAGGDYNKGGLREGQAKFDGTAARSRRGGEMPLPAVARSRKHKPGWPLDKSLAGIPQAYQLSLAYGRNVLSGLESPAGMWRVRNLIAWVRPNPPVGALSDKYRPATSYITVATRARDRWFDLDAIRTPSKDGGEGEVRKRGARSGGLHIPGGGGDEGGFASRSPDNLAGAPPLDWWEIPPGGYSGAHYAVWPPELCRRLIDSTCPRRVCAACGKPSRREVVTEPSPLSPEDRVQRTTIDAGRAATRPNGKTHMGIERRATTTGWSTCGCPGTDGMRLDGFHAGTGWRPGVVLDPFVGSGTTLAVASGMGRDSVGIDLDARNAVLALERVGPMFLDVEWPPPDFSLPVLPPGGGDYSAWVHLLDTDVAESEEAAPVVRRNGRQVPVLAGQVGMFEEASDA